MPLAQLDNIEKTFGARTIFRNLSFQIDRGERVGLIGDNGAGKTSLFKLFIGELTPDAGSVSIARSAKVGYLAQDASFDPQNTVIDEAELAFERLHTLAHDLRQLEHDMAVEEGEALDRTLKRYERLLEEFESEGGYAWKHKLEATLDGVGLARETWEQNVQTLSGGQKSRLALAKLLISEPDLLLLDEPTNHLDLQAIEWLEEYLLGFSGAVWLISHDRYLLDRVATRIVWLKDAELRSYPGNFSNYLQQRELHELTQQRAYEQQQAFIEKTEEFIRRFGAGQRAREAQGREKRLHRLMKSDQMVRAVDHEHHIRMTLDTDQRAGDQVLQVRDLKKSFDGREVWANVKFDIRRGDRVGIVGPNGSGKTTLLRILIGEADADSGIVKWGANLSIQYYDQKLDDFDDATSVLDQVKGATGVLEKKCRDTLGALLFHGDDVYKPMGLLSGGERARVAFAQLLLNEPNVILLDEPTNHLDIKSSEALERALDGFGGTILCVSHDRYFLDRIARRLLVLEPPALVEFDGTLKRWMEKKRELSARSSKPAKRPEVKAAPKPAQKSTKSTAKPAKQDNPYLRPYGRLTFAELENQIQQAEAAITECEQSFGDPAILRDAAAGKRLQEKYEKLKSKLVDLEAEYFARE